MALGLLGFGALAISQLMSNSMKSQRNVTLSAERDSLRQLVELAMGSQNLCSAALQGQSLTTSATAISQLALPGKTLQTGQVFEGLKVLSMTLAQLGTTPSETFTNVSGSPFSAYPAELKLELEKQGQVAGAPKSTFSTFLNVVVAGTPPTYPAAITGCFSQSSIAQNKLEFCQMLGGTYTPGPPASCDRLQLREILLGSYTTRGLITVYEGGGTDHYSQMYGKVVTTWDGPHHYGQMMGPILSLMWNTTEYSQINGPSIYTHNASGFTQFLGPWEAH